MATRRRDGEGLRRALLPWLREKIPDARAISLSLPRVPDSGGSSETYFLAADISAVNDRREQWVLRIEASDYRVYEQSSIARQYQTLKLLGEKTLAPVPAVLWHEEDESILGEAFFLMQKVEGTVPKDRFHSEGLFVDASPAERETMWLSAIQAMATIHTADTADFRFLDRPAVGSTPLDQEMVIWDSYSRWTGVPLEPVQERAWRWLNEHLPARKPVGLSWGDARLGNTIYRDRACVALLDWETVSLSGAECDLGWWTFYDWLVSDGHGLPRLPGLPTPAATLEYWEEIAGRRALDIEWFVVFAAWRFSMIRYRALHLSRLMGLQVIDLPKPDPILRYLEQCIGT